MNVSETSLQSILAAAAARQDQPVPSPAKPANPNPATSDRASLWDILTPEEQAFFDAEGGMENLAYGPQRSSISSVPPALGIRLDVKA